MFIEESRESERDASSSSRELGIARARQRIDVQEGLAQSRSVRPRRTGGAARQERQLPWRGVGRKSCDAEVVRTCSLGGGSATGARGEHGHCAQEKSRIDEAKRRPAPSTSDTQSYAHFPLLDQPAPTTLVGWCWLARRKRKERPRNGPGSFLFSTRLDGCAATAEVDGNGVAGQEREHVQRARRDASTALHTQHTHTQTHTHTTVVLCLVQPRLACQSRRPLPTWGSGPRPRLTLVKV